MIIQLESARADNVLAGFREFINLGYRWGEDIADVPMRTASAHIQHPHALRVSIPPAALAGLDPADRIGKRRRAEELIATAQYMAAGQVPTWLISPGRIVELGALTPDQLLDLAEEDLAD